MFFGCYAPSSLRPATNREGIGALWAFQPNARQARRARPAGELERIIAAGSRRDRRVPPRVALLVVEAVDLRAVVGLETEHHLVEEVENFDGR